MNAQSNILQIAFLAGSILFPWSLEISRAAEPQKKYLSETDSDYAALAVLQKAACDKYPNNRRCRLSYEECIESMSSMVKNLKDAVPEATENMFREVAVQMCNDRATPYEFPGSRSLLEMRVKDVESFASQAQISLPKNFIIGSIELPEVNAEVEVKTSGGRSIVLVNTIFFEFTNEFVKLVVQNMTTKEGEWIAVERQPDAVRRRFQDNLIAMQRMTDLIDYFYQKGNEKYHAPDLLSGQMQLAYTAGIENFAVGHELGHVVRNDPSSSLTFSEVTDRISGLFQPSRSKSLTRMRELNADVFSLALMLQMQKVGANDRNIEKALALFAVEFYFISHSIIQDAGEISGYGADRAPKHEVNTADLDKIVECVHAVCDLREVDGLSDEITGSEAYPSDELRRAVVRRLISEVKTDGSDDENLAKFLATADAVNKNAEVLWKALGPHYVATHTRGAQ